MNLDRRTFLRSATATGVLAGTNWKPLQAQAAHVPEATDKTVALNGDSPPITYEQHTAKLVSLMTKGNYADTYLKGGAVTEFEQHMANLLGKEDAAFFPTGTLANNIAVRLLCGDRKNLLIQHEAHLYQDEGEGPSLLSGINMIPIGPNKACPALDEWNTAIEIAGKSAYYPTRIGAISIESPRPPSGRSLRPLRRSPEDHRPRTFQKHRHPPRRLAPLPPLRNPRFPGQALLRPLRYRLRLHL